MSDLLIKLAALLSVLSPLPVVYSLHTVQTIASNNVAGNESGTSANASYCDVIVFESYFYHNITKEVVQCKSICPPTERKVSDQHRKFCHVNCEAYYNCFVETVVDNCNNTEMIPCLSQCFDAVASSTIGPSNGDLSTNCRPDGNCSKAVLCILKHMPGKNSSSPFPNAGWQTMSHETVTKLPQAEPTTGIDKARTRTLDVLEKTISKQNVGNSNSIAIAAVSIPVAIIITVSIILVIRQGCGTKKHEKQPEQNKEEDSESLQRASNSADDTAAETPLKTVKNCHRREPDVEDVSGSMSVQSPNGALISLRCDDPPPIQCSGEDDRDTKHHVVNLPEEFLGRSS